MNTNVTEIFERICQTFSEIEAEPQAAEKAMLRLLGASMALRGIQRMDTDSAMAILKDISDAIGVTHVALHEEDQQNAPS